MEIMEDRIFTIEEAEELLPRLEPLVRDMIENRKSLMQIGNDLAALQEKVKHEEGRGIEASALMNKQTELDFLARIINENLEAIEAIGAQPKDLDMGLIDFPAIVDGEPALLCWKLGEKSIQFYHRYEDGFGGRKPLPRSRA